MVSATVAAPADLEQIAREQMEAWSVPGLAVGVLHDGRVETWSFGVTSIETGQPVTPDTLFQIGSITKVFTATVIMQLVDEGKLDLDRPVKAVLPSFTLEDAAATESVTPRQLLTHTGGFYGDRFTDYGLGDDALAKALAEFHTLRQYTPPGEGWAYCNTGYQALGGIIETLAGMTAERAIREHVIEPLGLERSFFFAHEAITYSVAVGHTKPPEKDLAVARPYALTRCMNAAGAIIGTTADLLRFAAFHMGDGRVDHTSALSKDSLRIMQTPQVTADLSDYWGLGWSLDAVGGAIVAGHGGSTNGFRAKLSLVPERGVALAVLANGNGGRPVGGALERWFLERYAGLRRTAPPVITLRQDALARLAGHYRGPTSEIDVTVAGDGLQIDMVTTNVLTGEQTTLPPQQMRPTTARRFILADGESVGEPVDFLGDGETPRFMRYHGRLVDRVD